ncbi:hypothetical protein PRIPAC_91341 [Pristionchus pacificus]|nr:hypothetical protein PRIPAC_91341 [Pristionchus pacificus]
MMISRNKRSNTHVTYAEASSRVSQISTGTRKSILVSIEIKKPYKCNICEKRFFDSTSLARHKKSHGPEKDLRPFECDTCGKSYKEKSHLAIHQITHGILLSKKTYYKCEVCEMNFPTQYALNGHKPKHLGIAKEPVQAALKRQFQCDICGKKLVSSNYLQKHKRLHSSSESISKPHKCDICDKRFTDAQQVKRHMISHVPKAERTRFECNICHKTYASIDCLSRHKPIHEILRRNLSVATSVT